MKTLNYFTIVILLLASPLLADAKENDKSNYDFIVEKIQSTFQVPEEMRTEQGDSRVLVVFSIGTDGIVSVHEVGTNDELLKATIVEQFEAMKFDNTTQDFGGMYSIRLNFKTL